MPGRRKLIVVSNRGPVEHALADDGARIARRGSGGLATALRGLLARHDVTWIASAITPEDRAVAAGSEGAIAASPWNGAPYSLRLVAHDPATYDRFYNVVANPVLWFVQHGLWDLAVAPELDDGFRHAWDEGYVPVNQALAQATIEELARNAGAAVVMHDYHLYLAPALVRASVPDARLAHFVHVPWPAPDAWRVLPEPIRRAVHEGLLASDVVSFHTQRWLDNFLRCVAEFTAASVSPAASRIHVGERTVAARVRPISVDPDEFEELRRAPAVLQAEERIAAGRRGELVVRVDRADPSKNVVRGFRAFELLLERYPEHVGRVTLLALLAPSRQGIPQYAAYLAAARDAAARVNARFATASWAPVDIRVRDDFAESVAAYKQYDVLLVNPIVDGMNLVAKEGPLLNERDGVLVLSENAGAHEELGAFAVTVNPFDVGAQAEALHAALVMPLGERRSRLEALRATIRANDVDRWIALQLEDLDAIGSGDPA